jgi:hypothetical protein|nr:MAG TPA: hypothetical protein [Caudoviricetes sp.]
MAYNYQAYISKYDKKLKDLDNQINTVKGQISNFDNTYDHTKDAGWIAANNQIQNDAKIAANNAYGRLSNRIGATSTAQQVASDSVYANALKNSQNLIPTYKDAALNKLNNQYSVLQNQYSNLLALDQQDYSRWSDENNFNYQKYLNDQNAKASQITAQAAAQKTASDNAKKVTQEMIDAYGNGNVTGRKNLYNYILSLDSDYSDYVEDALEKLGLNRNWFKTAATLRQKAGYGSQLMK